MPPRLRALNVCAASKMMTFRIKFWIVTVYLFDMILQTDAQCAAGYAPTRTCESVAGESYWVAWSGDNFCSDAYCGGQRCQEVSTQTDFRCADACSRSACCGECQHCIPQSYYGCTACPNGKVSGGSACVCPAGKELASGGGCSDCTAGKYGADGSCYDCPTNSNSPVGSTISTACTCNAGYIGLAGGTCSLPPVVCGAGSYFTPGVCVDTYEVWHFGRQGDDGWIEGYYEYCAKASNYCANRPDPPSCTVCCNTCQNSYECTTPPGTCTACGSRKFNEISPAPTACSSCPENSGAACTNCLAQTECQCDAGYSGASGGTCTQCVPGKYKVNQGSACSDCDAGKFSTAVGATANVCGSCPGNSNSPISSSALGACTCNVGHSGPNGGTCNVCAAGKFKDTTGSATCTNCGAGTYSAVTGATVATVCTNCTAGTYSVTAGATVASVCVACPGNSYSPASSSALIACTCNAGSSGPNGGACTLCVAGKFKGTPGTATCTNCGAGTYSAAGSSACAGCPSNSSSPASSVVLTACTCNVGYSGPNGGACRACVAGKYKTATGSVACTDCTAAKYSTVVAATVATTCLACQTNSNSPVASSASAACTCNAGFTGPDGVSCMACVTGTYKDTTGSVACTTCPGASNSPGTSLALTACICNLGFTGPNGGTCTACVAGKYKILTGTSACIDCAAAKYSTVSAATAAATCLTCSTSSTSPAASSACTCNPGFTGPNSGTCTACDPGKFKSTSGSATCTTCPDGSNSASASVILTACICNLGFTGPNGGTCAACVAGTYKVVSGTFACLTCAVAKYSTTSAATAAATCLACPASSNSPISSSALTACTCNAGSSGANGGLCTQCRAGTYKIATGNASCAACVAGTFSGTGGASTCETCVAGTSAATNSSACTNCGVAKYSNATGAAVCSACPANSGASCVTCPTQYCPCNAGYAGGNIVSPYSVTACARFIALTPKPSLASVSTRLNPAVGTLPTYNPTGGPNGKGHVSFNRASYQYLDGGSRTFNINTNGGFTMIIVFRLTGTPILSEVILNMGGSAGFRIIRDFEDPDLNFESGGEEINSYYYYNFLFQQNSWFTVKYWYRASTLEVLHEVNNDLIWGATVPLKVDTTGPVYLGAYNPTDTTWNLNADIAGFFLVDEYMTEAAMTVIADAMTGGLDLTDTTCPSGNACTACGAGSYQSATGTACTGCPSNSNSPVLSTAVAACTCNAGYSGQNGGTCDACGTGKYKNTPGNSTCIDCGAGTYSAVAGASACTTCPANASSPISSTAATDCTCPIGYQFECLDSQTWIGSYGGCSVYKLGQSYNDYCEYDGVCTTCCQACANKCSSLNRDGSPCTSCVPGTYKNTTGSAACTSCASGTYSSVDLGSCLRCPDKTNSPASSSALTACTCNVGFTGPNGGPCTQCVNGKYKNVSGSGACTNCSAGMYSDTAGGTACTWCPMNTVSLLPGSTSSQCVCAAGYETGNGTVKTRRLLQHKDIYHVVSGDEPNFTDECPGGQVRTLVSEPVPHYVCRHAPPPPEISPTPPMSLPTPLMVTATPPTVLPEPTPPTELPTELPTPPTVLS